MVLNLIQTSVRSISRHEKTEGPFVRSTGILLEESWGDIRLKDKPAPKIDAEAGWG